MGTSALLPLVILSLFSCHAIATSAFLSRDAIALAGAIEGDEVLAMQNRHLLQTSTPCPVSFESLNYTILTSQCKGPSYPSGPCCSAFLLLACPFASEINDDSTDCAINLFNYINIHGSYPSGLFANECTNGTAEGLPCPASAIATPPPPTSRAVQHESGHEILWWAFLTINTVMILSVM